MGLDGVRVCTGSVLERCNGAQALWEIVEDCDDTGQQCVDDGVYNSDGFIEENKRGVYSFNNVTAKVDKGGGITMHFGGREDDRINCVPISKGWNYTVRLYQPREEILNGSWTFPEPKPVN